jgi:hypothetical protein
LQIWTMPFVTAIGGRLHDKSKRTRTPKAALKLPDLEQSKSAVLNSLTSAQFPTIHRSRDQRIHPAVLFRA